MFWERSLLFCGNENYYWKSTGWYTVCFSLEMQHLVNLLLEASGVCYQQRDFAPLLIEREEHPKYKPKRDIGKHLYTCNLINEWNNGDQSTGNKELSYAFPFLNKKKAPNKTIKYTLTTRHQTLHCCLYLHHHDKSKAKVAGVKTVGEGLYLKSIGQRGKGNGRGKKGRERGG